MAGIRSILLHVDATQGSLARVALAHVLADRHHARVTALFGVRPQAGSDGFAYSAGAALRGAEESELHERERARLRELLAGRQPEFDWCEVVGDSLGHGVVGEAAFADLLILGQPARADEDGAAPHGFTESVILASGTPAIVVPHPHRQETIGDSVLIAWDGSVASARAMKSALPLILPDAQVHVAVWAKHQPTAPFSRLDAVAWLLRHGIDAQLHRRDPVAHVADELAGLAAEVRADLVVMGCYGHSRVREQVFGGVTRSSLATLPVPILMAH